MITQVKACRQQREEAPFQTSSKVHSQFVCGTERDHLSCDPLSKSDGLRLARGSKVVDLKSARGIRPHSEQRNRAVADQVGAYTLRPDAETDGLGYAEIRHAQIVTPVCIRSFNPHD